MAYNPLNINGQAVMANSQPVVIASNQSPVSVTGTVNIAGSLPSQSVSGTVGSSVIGTVPVTQVSNPWVITGSVQGSFSPSGNQSVSGTVGASIIGTAPVTQSGTWAVSVVGSLPPQSVSGTVGSSVIGTVPVTMAGAWTTSVVGTVATTQAGTWISSIVSTVPSSVLVGASAFGTFPVTQSGAWSVSVSGTLPPQSVSGTVGASIIGSVPVNVQGSVLSVTVPTSSWISGTASAFTGVIQPIIPAQGTSIFSYITGVQVANASANNAYLTFYGATSSVVGYTVVPANGGSNIYMAQGWKTNANGAFSASLSGVASVFLSAEGFTSNV